jgi:hypothetical protein
LHQLACEVQGQLVDEGRREDLLGKGLDVVGMDGMPTRVPVAIVLAVEVIRTRGALHRLRIVLPALGDPGHHAAPGRLAIEGSNPARQLGRVVPTRREADVALLAEPVDEVGPLPAHHDGGAVLGGQRDHAAALVRLLHPVAQRRDPEVARRAADLLEADHGRVLGVVFGAVHAPAVLGIQEAVAGDAGRARVAAGQHRHMTGTRLGHGVIEGCLLVDAALAQQAAQPSGQIGPDAIRAELVDGHEDNQARGLARGGTRKPREQEHDEQPQDLQTPGRGHAHAA